MKINVLGRAPHIGTDFGKTDVLAHEDERAAAIRVYRDWCKGFNPPHDSVEPDASPVVVLHDVR